MLLRPSSRKMSRTYCAALLLCLYILTPSYIFAESNTDHIILKTHNNMGYMAVTFDEITQKFIEHVKKTKGTYLDAGAAFGSATLAALDAGAGKVVANDLETSHLNFLNSKVKGADKGKITTIAGDFPDAINLEPNSLDGILMARLLHFFDGPKIEKALRKSYSWLKPGSKAFIITVSPHVHQLKRTKRIIEKRKKQGMKWPGFFENIYLFAPGFIGVTPKSFHVLTQDIMEKKLKEVGFKVIYAKASSFTPWAKDVSPDGSEILGFVVEK